MKIIDDKIVFVSPIETEKCNWGVYQFPKLTLTADKKILLSVSNKIDAEVVKERTGTLPLFLSSDNGGTFQDVSDTEIGKKYGDDICFRFEQDGVLYSFPFAEKIPEKALGATPVFTNRLGSYPASGRKFSVYDATEFTSPLTFTTVCEKDGKRTEYVAPLNEIKSAYAIESELNYVTMETVKFERAILPPQLFNFSTCRPLITDKYWLSLAIGQPVLEDREIMRKFVQVYKSTDRGKSWKMVSEILPPNDLVHGFGVEFALARNSQGTIALVIRTRECHQTDVPHYLATYYSVDEGNTFVEQKPVSDHSVTPVLMQGKTETVLFYGRPGIYYRTSTDNIRWSESHTLLGPDEDSIPKPTPQDLWDKIHHKYTCANLCSLPIGNGKFLLTYSDFLHEVKGKYHKAIHVATVCVD